MRLSHDADQISPFPLISCSEIIDLQRGLACTFACSGSLGKQADRSVLDSGGLTYVRSSVVKAIGSDFTIHQSVLRVQTPCLWGVHPECACRSCALSGTRTPSACTGARRARNGQFASLTCEAPTRAINGSRAAFWRSWDHPRPARLPNGAMRRVALLDGNDMGDPDRALGILTYSFDKRLVPLLRGSSVLASSNSR